MDELISTWNESRLENWSLKISKHYLGILMEISLPYRCKEPIYPHRRPAVYGVRLQVVHG